MQGGQALLNGEDYFCIILNILVLIAYLLVNFIIHVLDLRIFFPTSDVHIFMHIICKHIHAYIGCTYVHAYIYIYIYGVHIFMHTLQYDKYSWGVVGWAGVEWCARAGAVGGP